MYQIWIRKGIKFKTLKFGNIAIYGSNEHQGQIYIRTGNQKVM